MVIQPKTQTHTQYIYSTATLKEATIGVVSGIQRPPRGKCGQTTLTAIVRIDQQDGTTAVEPLELLDEMEVPLWITDKMIHKKICSYKSAAGINYSMSRMDKGREWIDFHGETATEGMVRIWREAIHDLMHGCRSFCSFPPYQYQEELVTKVVNRYSAGSTDILLAAIMRSGKCLITYQIAKRIGAKKILVITGKTGVNESWSALLPGGAESHVEFAGWKYHDYKKLKSAGLVLSAETDVVFVSLQYLQTHLKKGILPQLVNNILAVDWDLIVFDEQHWATQTAKTKELLSQLRTKYKIELSGTAYKTLIQGRYEEIDIIAFDYIDEQHRRFNGTPEEQKALEFRPDINYALIGVSTKVKELVEASGKGFSFSKLFAVADEQVTFEDPQSVVEFLSFVHQHAYKNRYEGDMAKFKKYTQFLSKHALWVIPNSIKSATALEQVLDQHSYFSKYKVINATGNGTKNITEVQQIINNVDAGKYDGKVGTITITCGRFLEGTTVPQWWTVHQMNDDKSAADYFQGCFRTKSEDKRNDKRHTLVYDYNPERFIQVVYEANIDSTRKANGASTGDIIRQWLEVSGVYDYNGNQFNLLDGATIIERANKDISLKINMFNSVGIDVSKVDAALQAMMFGHNTGNHWQATTSVNSNGIPQTPNQQVVSKNPAKGTTKNQKDPAVEAAEKFKVAMSRLPNLIWSTYGRNPVGCYDDLCNYPDVGFIAEHTYLTPSEWKQWKKAIPNVTQIDRRIDSLNEWYKK